MTERAPLGRSSTLTGRVAQWVRDVGDWFIAADPAWSRLRQGLHAVVAVASTLVLELVLAELLDRPAGTILPLGGLVAMFMTNGIRETDRAVIARTVAIAPFMAAAGTSLAVLSAAQRLLSLAAFVVITFVAVWIRRFGTRWFALGFLSWMAFFFGLITRPSVSALPVLLLVIVVAAAWAGVLLLTVFFDDPQVRVRRIMTSLTARARSGIVAAAHVLEAEADTRSVRALYRQLRQLSDVALLLDGQLSDPDARPDGVAPARVRRWCVDVEIGMDEVTGAVLKIAEARDQLSAAELRAVGEVLQHLRSGEKSTVLAAARRLQSMPDAAVPAAGRLAAAAVFLQQTLDSRPTDQRQPVDQLEAAPDPGDLGDGDGVGVAPGDPGDDDFEPAVTLANGNLPGSAAVAKQTLGKPTGGRFSSSCLLLTTRQAIQAAIAAALAIVAGELISSSRYYWAVIATFVAFAGTSTVGEMMRKEASRIAGTVVGLLVAVGLANVTAGNSGIALAVILLCIFFAFSLQTLSYGAMIFFITVLLGQLYGLMKVFSDALMLVRLTETLVGAAIGVVVSQVVLPTHSKAALRAARRSFLQDLGDLLESCAQVLDGTSPARSPLTLTIVVEASGRQLANARNALTAGRLFGSDRAGIRSRVSLMVSCAATARAFAAAIAATPPAPGLRPQLAQDCRELATEAGRLAAVPDLGSPPPPPAGTDDVLANLRRMLDPAQPDQTDHTDVDGPRVLAPDRPAVLALRRLADALALLGGLPGATVPTTAPRLSVR